MVALVGRVFAPTSGVRLDVVTVAPEVISGSFDGHRPTAAAAPDASAPQFGRQFSSNPLSQRVASLLEGRSSASVSPEELVRLMFPQASEASLLTLYADALDRAAFARYRVRLTEGTLHVYTRSNGKPYVRFTAADGRLRRISLERLAKQTELAVRCRQWANSPIRWEDATREYLKRCTYGRGGRRHQRKSDAQAKRDEAVLGRLARRFGGQMVHSTTRKQLDEYISERAAQSPRGREGGLSVATVNREIAVITSFFRFMDAEEHLDRNPARGLRQSAENNSRADKAATAAELLLIRQALPESPPDYRDLFDLLADTGMRVGEVLTLKHRSYRASDSSFFLLKTKQGKPAVCPVPKGLRAMVERRVAVGGGYLFSRADGKPYTRDQVRDVFYRAQREAGLGCTYRVHDLRHSFATRAYRQVGLLGVQKLLHHSSPAVTIRYIGVTEEYLRDAVDASSYLAEAQSEHSSPDASASR